jgi:bacillolysin
MGGRSVRSVRVVAAEMGPDELAGLTAMVSFDAAPEPAEAARAYLDRVLALDAAMRTSFDGTVEDPPETRLAGVQGSRLTGSSVVRFRQRHASIPVFGSHVAVEVADGGGLIAVDAEVATVSGTAGEPTIDALVAARSIAAFAEVSAEAVVIAEPPTLKFFQDDVDGDGEPDRWHLIWHFKNVPVAPAQARDGHGHGRSPRQRNPVYDYLVDAHDGAVVFHHSRTPRARKPEEVPAIPIRCTGLDEAGTVQEFYGQVNDDGAFVLVDPLRRLRTVDLAGADLDDKKLRVPKQPIFHGQADFGDTHRAAVSAHVNVGRIVDFFRNVLMRDSVDDEGMEIVSIVNCVSSADEAPPSWSNAIWYEDRMWYGQCPAPDGRMRSLAVCLELVGHELMHGVIERTAGLIYRSASGALNESLADILGVIAANWATVGPDAVDRWSWTFGAELGTDGRPIRDLQDPRRTGDPDHMKNYLKTREDEGGVHTNSNIHNKAAYLLLTAKEADGSASLTAREVAVLYYLCLVRLPQRPTFARVLRGLLDVATTYFKGDKQLCARKLSAIERAYSRVGITLEE